MDKVVSGIQLEHRVDAFALVKGLDLLCIFLNCFQDWIAGLGLFVPQRAVSYTHLLVKDRLIAGGILLHDLCSVDIRSGVADNGTDRNGENRCV